MMTQSMLTKITTNKYALFTTNFDSTQTSFCLPFLIEILSSVGQQIGIVLVIMSHLPRNRMVNTHRWWTNARTFFKKFKSMFKTTIFKTMNTSTGPSFVPVNTIELLLHVWNETFKFKTETHIFTIVHRNPTIRTKPNKTHSRSFKEKQHWHTKRNFVDYNLFNLVFCFMSQSPKHLSILNIWL